VEDVITADKNPTTVGFPLREVKIIESLIRITLDDDDDHCLL
jgi:hypothetical protein